MNLHSIYRHWWQDEQLQMLIRCALIACAVILIGTLGFKLIEDSWTYWDAFYFTVVTVSTVGYGDYHISEPGRVFAAFLIICGIGAFTFSLSNIIQIASDHEAAMRRQMKRIISDCRDHIIVCGYGRMGQMICSELDESSIEIVVIEINERSVRKAIEDGRLVVEGVASADNILMQAGIEYAQGVVCAVDSDAENMFVTISAKDLNPDCRVISRAESLDAARKLERAGASLVVSPHQMAGKTIATSLLHPRLSRFLGSSKGNGLYFELGEVVIEKGSSAEGRTVAEIGEEMKGLTFVAVERKGQGFNEDELIIQPNGAIEFHAEDVLIFAGAGPIVDRMHKAAKSHGSRVLVNS